MRIFALSDPHYGRDMSRFGEVWKDHEAAIRRNWQRTVRPGDVVLIPGDFSWATTTKTIERHLDEVNALPGHVVVSPGNHDKWWSKTSRLRYSEVEFLCNAHRPLNDEWTLAAAMGWESPESKWWREAWRPIYETSLTDLDATLAAATADRPHAKILLMLHHPPRWAPGDTPTEIEKILARYPVDLVVYGHIHGPDLWLAHNGIYAVGERQVRYENASVDRIAMTPIPILDI